MMDRDLLGAMATDVILCEVVPDGDGACSSLRCCRDALEYRIVTCDSNAQSVLCIRTSHWLVK